MTRPNDLLEVLFSLMAASKGVEVRIRHSFSQGDATMIKQRAVTQESHLTHDRQIKESWCLATSRADLGTGVKQYSLENTCGLDSVLRRIPVRNVNCSLQSGPRFAYGWETPIDAVAAGARI